MSWLIAYSHAPLSLTFVIISVMTLSNVLKIRVKNLFILTLSICYDYKHVVIHLAQSVEFFPEINSKKQSVVRRY